MKRVLFIQHGDTDKPGLLGEVLSGLGVAVDVAHPYEGQALPITLENYAGLAVGGGAQSAYEEEKYPYLRQECDLIRAAEAEGKPAIGLCLGAQLMARAFGAEVRRAARREIGFFDVNLEPIAQFDPLWCDVETKFPTTHWHGDVFEIPVGGMRMGSSEMTPNQLFRYGPSMYGLQFHLEMTPDLLDELVDDSADYLAKAGVDPEQMKREGRECLPRIEETARTVFTRWAGFL